MIKNIAILIFAIFLISLIMPISLAYSFGDSNLNLTFFINTGSQLLTSNNLNLSYTIDEPGYFKSDNNINLTLPSLKNFYNTPENPSSTPAPGAASSGPRSTSSKQPTSSVLTDRTIELKAGKSITFNIKQASHNLYLDSIDRISKKANLILSSAPIRFSLSEKETRQFDADNNTINDLNITLQDLKTDRTTIRILEIAEPQPLTTIPTTSIQQVIEEITGEVIKEQEQVIAPEDGSKGRRRLITLVIGSLIIIGIAIFLAFIKKKKK